MSDCSGETGVQVGACRLMGTNVQHSVTNPVTSGMADSMEYVRCLSSGVQPVDPVDVVGLWHGVTEVCDVRAHDCCRARA